MGSVLRLCWCVGVLGCQHWCGRYLEQMKVTLHTVGRIDGESISPDARDTLMHAFRDWDAQRRMS